MDLLQRWKVEGKKKIMIIYFVPEKKGEHVMCAEVEGKKKNAEEKYIDRVIIFSLLVG